MDLAPIPIPTVVEARQRGIVRGERLLRVKFVGLPPQGVPGDARGETRAPGRVRRGLAGYLLRVIGRLVAARP